MKRTAILASAGAVALGFSLVVCVVPSLAEGSHAKSGGFNIDRDNLPKVKPYRSPIQVDIVDDGPIIKDRRERKLNQVYQLQIEPLGPEETQTSVYKVPGGTGSGGSTARGGAPGTFIIDPSQPPRARFGTNIPAGGVGPANALPNGTTTNRLMGANANARGKLNAPSVTVKKGDLLQRTIKPSTGPTQTMTYKDNSSAATGSAISQKTVKTDVSGTLKSPVKRGEYLKPPR